MFKAPAKTPADTVRIEGVGLHSGAPCAVELRPSRAGGLRLVKGGRVVPVHVDHVDAPGGSTRFPGLVETPEHLLAAVVGLGITDLEIRVEGPEIPALDGSAAQWAEQLGEPVITGEYAGLAVEAPVSVEAFGGTARAWPADTLQIAVDVDFGPACRGAFELAVTPASFRAELAWARTFLPHADLDAVQAAGRGRGAGPGSVVLLGARGPLVPLRGPDEPIRHKALDLLGDLALVGAPLRGRFEVTRGTHALHHALVREVLRASR
ncbi:MAG: UDP-3-O-acyl-N-acetylglucosamine deacetylase [Alphaproteobacteria bacterium]|nr:UDP-3-O-acyl-N-acetylglucosamine deacetylase [Alphaproteobacteria bacterium]